LFFGNVNESKGIDILLKAFNILPASVAEKSNIIIAGKDFDGNAMK
jgi:glycosyltransferase involved in cell wall biosynthesis